MPKGSPYVGLEPFTEQDAEFFFGRERDQDVVEANLYAARLSILYGATGVGKSSVLLAGVVPQLARSGRAIVVVFRDWQGAGFALALRRACVKAAGVALDEQRPLDELLLAITERTRRPVFVLLDQFEEYLLNHPSANGGGSFEAELARAVNRADVEASFLLALREDAIGGLDRFGPRIPRLLTNRIRLGHLTPEGAARAIREPLRVWHERTGETVPVDDELVDELLGEVRAGSAEWLLAAREESAAPRPPSGGDEGIEAPLLQLVLERLWEHGAVDGGHALQVATYRRLGKTAGIARHHFEDVLERMSDPQRELCSRLFDHLVTPSGGKIAYPVADLVKLADELAPEVPSTVAALADARILHRVQLPDYEGCELFHDVLAPAVLEWRRRLVEQRRREEERRRRRRRALRSGALLVVLLALVAALLGYRRYTELVADRPWAALTNLATGTTSTLSGTEAIVGRQTSEIDVDVSLPDRLVSRLHLLISRDSRRAMDVRSLNGTTVNGHFIPYGQSRPLRSGDVLVLGGAAALRYEPLEYGSFQLSASAPDGPRASGWGLLVDGRARSATELVELPSFIAVRNGRLVVLRQRGADAVAAVGLEQGVPVVIDLPGGPRLSRNDQQLDELRHGVVNSESLEEGQVVGAHGVLVVDGHRFQVVPTGGS